MGGDDALRPFLFGTTPGGAGDTMRTGERLEAVAEAALAPSPRADDRIGALGQSGIA